MPCAAPGYSFVMSSDFKRIMGSWLTCVIACEGACEGGTRGSKVRKGFDK